MQSAMRHVLSTIALADVPLVVVFGAASYVLARGALAPLVAARERERVFAADVAHELRSPLAAIAAVAQASRNGDATPASRAAFDTIATEALDASAIVGDLLTLARRPGQAVLQCEPVDLAAIVSRCARDAATEATAAGVRIDATAESAIVDGDERRLRELVRNLLENAIRHARSSVTIASQNDGRACTIVVQDDGEGIPAADRERVFERFYRRDGDAGGTGLGLAIARWIADAHGGSILVAQTDMPGARFVVTLKTHGGG
jgi:signal transduction histidine kinase